MELTILMPCLNEAKTVGTCVEKARRFLASSGIEGEVLIADNGSTDGSIDLAERLGARVLRVAERGYGAALSSGIYEARGQFVIMGDSDDSYDFLNLQPFVDKLREGYDLVMGNRFKGGIRPGAMPPMHRYFGNPLLSLLGRRIYEHEVCGDFYCGLRGFRAQAIRDLHVQSPGMEFALEMLIKAELYRLKISEVPTTLSPDGRGRRPHLKTYRDGWRSLRLYLLMSPRWTFGLPGLALLALGALLMVGSAVAGFSMLITEAVMVAGAVGVTLGYQSILLAIFAKFIAIETGLHPPLTKFWMLREEGTLERFVIAGAALTVLALLFGAFLIGLAAFDLLPEAVPHAAVVVFPATAFLLAGQTVLAGFYLGILQLVGQRRRFPRKRRGDDPGRHDHE